MTLREKQSDFVRAVIALLTYIHSKGYEVTFGDASRMDKQGHIKNSKHYKRLAIDLNLFKDGKYLSKTEDHEFAGEYWEKLGRKWGGRFRDGNHYEY